MGTVPAPWPDSFHVFIREVDGAPVSLTVSAGALEHGAAPSHPRCVRVRVALRDGDPHGLRRPQEAEEISALEERVAAHLERELDAWWVARLFSGGSAFFVFYAPAGGPLSPIGEADRGVYEPEIAVVDDPEWAYLLRVLAPDELERWQTYNRQVELALERAGDRLERPRRVDHVALFDGRHDAMDATTRLKQAGFAVDPMRAARDGVVLEFHREQPVTPPSTDAFVREIVDLLRTVDGRYDGWGAPIAR